MENKKMESEESFRDSIATIDKQGKRVWIYAQKPFGKLYLLRTYASYIYLVIFFSLPFIKINGDPFFLFNIMIVWNLKDFIHGVVYESKIILEEWSKRM